MAKVGAHKIDEVLGSRLRRTAQPLGPSSMMAEASGGDAGCYGVDDPFSSMPSTATAPGETAAEVGRRMQRVQPRAANELPGFGMATARSHGIGNAFDAARQRAAGSIAGAAPSTMGAVKG